MFTFKKIALVGVACLTAFSMSCSEVDEDSSGSFDPDISLGLDSDGYVVINGGTIVSNEGIKVKSVKATANGKDGVKLETLPSLPAATVNLKNVSVLGICDATGSKKEETFKIKITATFDDDKSIDTEKSIKVNCGESSPTVDPALTKKSITLSRAEKSYGDVDGATATYGQNDAKTEAILKKIDVVAYSKAGASKVVYTVKGAIIEEIVTDEIKATYDAATGSWKSVLFFPIPSADISTIKSASKLSDLKTFLSESHLDSIMGGDDLDNGDVEFAIDDNSGFLVNTTEGKLVAVLISSSGTETVTLGTTSW